MKDGEKEQSSAKPKPLCAILQNAREFWGWYEGVVREAEETHVPAGLKGLYAEYLDALNPQSFDLNRIESLTAQAAILMQGKRVY